MCVERETVSAAESAGGVRRNMEARLTGINRKETLQYLGLPWKRDSSGSLEEDISRCEQQILTTARPHAVWRYFELLPDGSLGGTAVPAAGKGHSRAAEGL